MNAVDAAQPPPRAEAVKYLVITAERLEEGAMLYLHENDKLFAMIPMSDVRCREVIEILRGAA